MHSTNGANLYIQMLPLNAFVQKEGSRVSQVKGKYVAPFLVLIQAIWLMGPHGTYVNKKFMLLVALIELQKLVSWGQVVFNNLHSRMWDFSIVIKLKKRRPWEKDKIRCNPSCRYHLLTLVSGRPNILTTEI
jgi:hypothetical protein